MSEKSAIAKKVLLIALLIFNSGLLIFVFKINSDADDNNSLSRFEVKPSFVHLDGVSSANQKGAVNKVEDESWRKVRVLCFVVTHPRALGQYEMFVIAWFCASAFAS